MKACILGLQVFAYEGFLNIPNFDRCSENNLEPSCYLLRVKNNDGARQNILFLKSIDKRFNFCNTDFISDSHLETYQSILFDYLKFLLTPGSYVLIWLENITRSISRSNLNVAGENAKLLSVILGGGEWSSTYAYPARCSSHRYRTRSSHLEREPITIYLPRVTVTAHDMTSLVDCSLSVNKNGYGDCIYHRILTSTIEPSEVKDIKLEAVKNMCKTMDDDKYKILEYQKLILHVYTLNWPEKLRVDRVAVLIEEIEREYKLSMDGRYRMYAWVLHRLTLQRPLGDLPPYSPHVICTNEPPLRKLMYCGDEGRITTGFCFYKLLLDSREKAMNRSIDGIYIENVCIEEHDTNMTHLTYVHLIFKEYFKDKSEKFKTNFALYDDALLVYKHILYSDSVHMLLDFIIKNEDVRLELFDKMSSDIYCESEVDASRYKYPGVEYENLYPHDMVLPPYPVIEEQPRYVGRSWHGKLLNQYSLCYYDYREPNAFCMYKKYLEKKKVNISDYDLDEFVNLCRLDFDVEYRIVKYQKNYVKKLLNHFNKNISFKKLSDSVRWMKVHRFIYYYWLLDLAEGQKNDPSHIFPTSVPTGFLSTSCVGPYNVRITFELGERSEDKRKHERDDISGNIIYEDMYDGKEKYLQTSIAWIIFLTVTLFLIMMLTCSYTCWKSSQDDSYLDETYLDVTFLGETYLEDSVLEDSFLEDSFLEYPFLEDSVLEYPFLEDSSVLEDSVLASSR